MLTVIFSLFFSVLLKYIQHLRKCRNVPLGPVPLPLIGNFHMVLHKSLHSVLKTLPQKYGNVLSTSLAKERFAIINDIDINRKTMHLKRFSIRPLSSHFLF